MQACLPAPMGNPVESEGVPAAAGTYRHRVWQLIDPLWAWCFAALAPVVGYWLIPRLIRAAGVQDLMPKARVNGGTAQALASPQDCVIAADLGRDEAYSDLLVITSVDLSTRTIRDVECVSTNINATQRG